MLVGVLLAVLNPQVISKIIGNNSGWLGVVIAAVVGAITLIPGFVAFPTAAMLLQNGAFPIVAVFMKRSEIQQHFGIYRSMVYNQNSYVLI